LSGLIVLPLPLRRRMATMSKTREVLMPIDDVNNLDDVVRLLGIGESFTTPAEAVQELFDEIEHLRAELEAARKRIPLSTLQREMSDILEDAVAHANDHLMDSITPAARRHQ
jgi:hypothetical protein